MEKVQYLTQPLTGSVHYTQGSQALIASLESVYENNQVPLGNHGLARQRAFGNDVVWGNWFYGCPQVQIKSDDAHILFDDRVVDMNNLRSHPLYDPSFLRDHWNEIRNGALPMPKDYAMELLGLSEKAGSGVRALKHSDLTEINQGIPVADAAANPYLKAFLGLSYAERAVYIKEHKARNGDVLNLYCTLADAQEEAQGRLSVFDTYLNLGGYNNVVYGYARVFGVPASVASLSAEGAANLEQRL